MVGQPYLLLYLRCPVCPGNPVRGLGIKRQDATKGNKLNVLAATCGHSWILSDGTAIAIKKGLAADKGDEFDDVSPSSITSVTCSSSVLTDDCHPCRLC